MKHVVTLFFSLALVILGAFTGSPLTASEGHEHEQGARPHGAHVHGVAQLNLAVDGRALYVELDSPAANIIGFEHSPSSDADRAAIDTAVAKLGDGDGLFLVDDAAGCRLEDVKIDSALIDTDEHAHSHADHGEKKRDGGAHADFVVVYHFNCAHPERIRQLDARLFEAFAGIEWLHVQYIVGDRQGAARLSGANHVINF